MPTDEIADCHGVCVTVLQILHQPLKPYALASLAPLYASHIHFNTRKFSPATVPRRNSGKLWMACEIRKPEPNGSTESDTT